MKTSRGFIYAALLSAAAVLLVLALVPPVPAQAQTDPLELTIYPTHNPMLPNDGTLWNGQTNVAVFGIRGSHGWVTLPIYDRSAPHYYFKRWSSMRLNFYKLTGVVNGVQQWAFLHQQLIGSPDGQIKFYKRSRGNPLVTWYWWQADTHIVATNPNPNNKVRVVCSGWTDVKVEFYTPATPSGWTYADQSLAFAPRPLEFPAVIQGGPPHGQGIMGNIGGNTAIMQETIETDWGTMSAVHDDATGEIVAYYSVLSDPNNVYSQSAVAADDAMAAADPGPFGPYQIMSNVTGTAPTTPNTWLPASGIIITQTQ